MFVGKLHMIFLTLFRKRSELRLQLIEYIGEVPGPARIATSVFDSLTPRGVNVINLFNEGVSF